METMGEGYAQYAAAIFHAALEVDAGGFLKVFGGAGYFGYFKAVHENLGDHFVVENKIIAVVGEIY